MMYSAGICYNNLWNLFHRDVFSQTGRKEEIKVKRFQIIFQIEENAYPQQWNDVTFSRLTHPFLSGTDDVCRWFFL